ncbi:MAG: peptidylprolyl isomerase [Methanomicrobiales archaeon]|nr:peptidylprolyl isomerase [Methanomicrobiales archaeon]
MAIKEGDFIQLSYTGRIEGMVFDTTDEDMAKEAGIHNPQALYGPAVIRVGSGHIVAGLEEAVIGKDVGEEGDVEVPPEKAFGAHDPNQVESVPIVKFTEHPVTGMRVKIDEKEGIVTSVIGRRVVVDFNSPLAGKTAIYHFSIQGVLEHPTEKVKGLIRLYVQREMEVTLTKGVLKIMLPPAIVYDRRWLLWRGRVVQEIFEYLPEVTKIQFIEVFLRPKPKEEKKQEAKTAEKTAEE